MRLKKVKGANEIIVKGTYYVDNPSLIVVSKEEYIYKYDILILA